MYFNFGRMIVMSDSTTETDIKEYLPKMFTEAIKSNEISRKNSGIFKGKYVWTTEELIKIFLEEKYGFHAKVEDFKDSKSRGDKKISQVVRNLVSHQKNLEQNYSGFKLTKRVEQATFEFVESVKFKWRPLVENSNLSRNTIIFGAPGTGKSYKIAKKLEEIDKNRYERVTFYRDYTYSQFVGTYKPIADDGEITYGFVPGPFLRILVKALKSGMSSKPESYYLIIEEINRADAASVFGDVFQLLDRNEYGESEYHINISNDVKKYLMMEFGGKLEDYSELKIPNNMFIWATMNSADQGVFPMDTAFKRRWNFEYLGVDDNEFFIDEKGKKLESQSCTFVVNGEAIEWNVFRRALNAKLSSENIGVNEDKLLGPFFIKVSGLDKVDIIDVICDKVIMYLFDDAVKTRRKLFFSGCSEENINRYSMVCSEFKKKGLDVFGKEFKKEYYDIQKRKRDMAMGTVEGEL